MGNGKWEIGNRKWEMGSRKLEFQKPYKAGFSERSTQILLRFHAMEPRVIAPFSKYVSSDQYYENADTTHFEAFCKSKLPSSN